MKIWHQAYILVLCNMQKSEFQNFDFQGGVPIWSSVKNRPFSVVTSNLSHLRTQVHEHLALDLIFGPLTQEKKIFTIFLFLRGAPHMAQC